MFFANVWGFEPQIQVGLTCVYPIKLHAQGGVAVFILKMVLLLGVEPRLSD